MTTVDGDGTTRHACEFVPIYMPAGAVAAGVTPITQQTLHTREALYGDAFPDLGTPEHSGISLNNPQVQWTFLNRETKDRTRWYQEGVFNCKKKGWDCDEFPYHSTAQGGSATVVPTPHLRLIDPVQNRSQGSDLGTFYNRTCNVAQGDLFMVVPVPSELLVTSWVPAVGEHFELVPTQHICPGR